MQTEHNTLFGEIAPLIRELSGRTILLDGDTHYVAKDVCDALEMKQCNLNRIPANQKTLAEVHTQGGPQRMLVLTEEGLCQLLVRSDKPKADQFKKWFFGTLLPGVLKFDGKQFSVKSVEERQQQNNPNMNIFQTFTYRQIPLRVIFDAGEYWFVVMDVCRQLKLTDPSAAVGYLDADEKGPKKIRTIRGMQELICVTEPGLYRLIARSNKPEAREFQRWICHEVLPSIGKTGGYQIGNPLNQPKGLDEREREWLKAFQVAKSEQVQLEILRVLREAAMESKVCTPKDIDVTNAPAATDGVAPNYTTCVELAGGRPAPLLRPQLNARIDPAVKSAIRVEAARGKLALDKAVEVIFLVFFKDYPTTETRDRFWREHAALLALRAKPEKLKAPEQDATALANEFLRQVIRAWRAGVLGRELFRVEQSVGACLLFMKIGEVLSKLQAPETAFNSTRSDLREVLSVQPYWIDAGRKKLNKRFGSELKQVATAWGINVDLHPLSGELFELIEGVK